MEYEAVERAVAQQNKTVDEKSSDRQLSMIYEQNEGNVRHGLVNSSFQEIITSWDDRIRAQHAAAAAAGDAARTARLDSVLSSVP